MISDRTLRVVLRSKSAVALLGDLIRALAVGAVFTVMGVCLGYYGRLYRDVLLQFHFNDFGKFYYSATFFLNGQNMYAVSPATLIPVTAQESRQFLNMNPPHFHLLLLPLTALPLLEGFLVWSFASIIALGVSIAMAAKEVRLVWTSRRLLLTGAVVVSASATGATVATGQLTFLLCLPVTLAWIAARRGAWTRAGSILGVVVSVKPFFGVFLLYLAVTRQWRALAASAAAAAAAVGAGLLVFGPQQYVNWMHALRAVSWPWAVMNGSIAGIVSRAVGESPMFVAAVAPWRFHAAEVIIVAVAVVGTSLWLAATDSSPDHIDRAFVSLFLAAMLASPLGWVYYLWVVQGPVLALWCSRGERPSAVRDALLWLAAPGLFAPVYLTSIGSGRPWGGVTFGSIYSWTTLLLWLAFIVDARATTRAGPAGSRVPASSRTHRAAAGLSA